MKEIFFALASGIAVAGCSTDGARPLSPDGGRSDASLGDRLVAKDATPTDEDAGTGTSTPPTAPVPTSEVTLRACASDGGATPSHDRPDDIYGLDGCVPAPSRFVVLGDSIAGCFGLDTSLCSPYLVADEVRHLASPDLAFETHAIFGSGVGDLPREAGEVAPGPGHVFVWIFSVGNDLPGLLEVPGADLTSFQAAMTETFAYFASKVRFPGGATFLLNGQYGLFDRCAAPGAIPGYTPAFAAQVGVVNKALFFDPADARSDTVAIDEYPDWLGHGANADLHGCPFCGKDNSRWLSDGVHPNALGHAHIAAKWTIALTQMLGPSCRRDR